MSQRGTRSIARPHAAICRPRRDLLARTALCGALIGFAAALATPASAITPVGPVGLPVQASTPPQVNAGGVLPTIVTSTNEVDVTLHGARTVIDWASFNVDAGNTVKYAFDARSWIVLNRIQDLSPPTIAGVVEGRVNGAYGGNIWFASPSGMIFGAGAKIDAGGILISAAAPDLAGFLDPSTLSFNVSGAELTGDVSITMQAGSAITGHGGLVALISPNITTEAGTTVAGQGGSSVLYGAAKGYQLRLLQGAPGDFDLVDFIVPDSTLGGGAPVGLDLQNATTANSVFVAAVSRSVATGAVINLSGMITAQAATADGGDIVLSGGGGIVGRAAGPAVGGTITDIYLNQASASRDIQVRNTGQVFGHPWANPDSLNPPAPVGGLGSVPNSVRDPSQVSVLVAGRDLSLVSTRAVALGEARAARDLSADGLALQANTLTVGGAVSLKTQAGDLSVAALSAGAGGAIQTQGAVQIDRLDLTGALKIKAATSVGIGRGQGAAGGGVITLTAGADVNVNAASANFDTVTAGGVANLKAAALSIGAVSAKQIVASGGTVSVGTATSAGDVYVSASGGAASVGTATAGDDIYVLATGGPASLTRAVLTGAAPDTIGAAFAGNPDAAGNGRVLAVQSTDGNALLGLGSGAVDGATKVSVQAGQDAIVDLPGALPASLSVSAVRDATLRASTVAFNTVQAGRDIALTATAGDISDTSLLVVGRNITIVTPGALTLGDVQAAAGSITLTGRTVTAGALSAGQDLALTVTGGDFSDSRLLAASRNITIGAPGALSLGDIQATSGSITLAGRTVAAGALSAGQDLALTATGGGIQLVSFKTGRDLIARGATLSLGVELSPIGRDLSLTTPGDFTSASDLAAGRDITLAIGGVANLKGLTGSGRIGIVAADLTLGGGLTAANVQIESATGALRIGGSASDGAPASGLWLDNAEFGRIRASQVNLYAGPTGGGARGDLTVLALDVNPQTTPRVNLFVGGGHNALVQGTIAPTTSGGILAIGDAANAAWRPASILVSGAIGSASFDRGAYTNVRAFDDVRLQAADDILIGSQRFIGLIQAASVADIEIGRNKPAGVAPTAGEQNRVLVTAGRLELSAGGKVVSQNTAPSAALSVGLFLNGTASPDLIIDPPQLVDLYGSFVGPAGLVVSSFSAGAGLTFAVVDSAGNPTATPLGAVYRFNSCAVGTSQCSAAAQVTGNLQQTNTVLTTPSGPPVGSDLGSDAGGGSGGESGGGGSGGGGGKGGSRANGQPGLLSVGSAETEELLSDPVITGAGSEEIWRKRDRGPDKAAKP